MKTITLLSADRLDPVGDEEFMEDEGREIALGITALGTKPTWRS